MSSMMSSISAGLIPAAGSSSWDQVGFEHQHSREFEQFLLAATELVGAVLPYLLKV